MGSYGRYEALMQPQHSDRRTRTCWSLEGLSVGDAFGERLMRESHAFPAHLSADLAQARRLPSGTWEYTDDTQMALSIVEILFKHGIIDQDQLARSFGAHFEPRRGYGMAMVELLPRLQAGQPWQTAAGSLFGGAGSFGNGAAMRVAPLGAFFADDLAVAVEQARRSAEVTHAHPEAIAGAIAVAVAAACAWRLRGAAPLPRGPAFLDQMLPHIPAGQVREGVAQAKALAPSSSVREAALALGNGSRVTAQDTVPFVLWCAAQHLDKYEEAMWLTASGLGDVDTNCAMVGGIVAAHTGVEGIPAEWLRRREPLPAWAFPSPGNLSGSTNSALAKT
jgi:ADP-ribosylglycohydrolase